MNGMELLEKMELVESAYVEEADAPPVRRRRVRGVWAAAACVCLLLGALLWPRSGIVTPEPQVGDFELSEGTTAKVTVGIEGDVGARIVDLVWLTEEELFRQEGLYAFRGRVSGLTNVTLDFNGEKEIRCIATVAVEKVYCGEVEEGAAALPGGSVRPAVDRGHRHRIPHRKRHGGHIYAVGVPRRYLLEAERCHTDAAGSGLLRTGGRFALDVFADG